MKQSKKMRAAIKALRDHVGKRGSAAGTHNGEYIYRTRNGIIVRGL